MVNEVCFWWSGSTVKGARDMRGSLSFPQKPNGLARFPMPIAESAYIFAWFANCPCVIVSSCLCPNSQKLCVFAQVGSGVCVPVFHWFCVFFGGSHDDFLFFISGRLSTQLGPRFATCFGSEL